MIVKVERIDPAHLFEEGELVKYATQTSAFYAFSFQDGKGTEISGPSFLTTKKRIFIQHGEGWYRVED